MKSIASGLVDEPKISELRGLAEEAKENARNVGVIKSPFIGRLVARIGKSQDGKIYWAYVTLDYSDIVIEITTEEAGKLIEDYKAPLKPGSTGDGYLTRGTISGIEAMEREMFSEVLSESGPLAVLKALEVRYIGSVATQGFSFMKAARLAKKLFEAVIRNDPRLLFVDDVVSWREHPILKGKLTAQM